MSTENPIGSLTERSVAMTRFVLFLVTIVFSFGFSQASELNDCVERIASSLFNGTQISQRELKDFFKEVKTSDTLYRRGSDTSEESVESAVSSVSVSSRESIDAVEEVLAEWIDEDEKSDKQVAARRKFIQTLQSMSEKREVDAITLHKALEMILGKLSG